MKVKVELPTGATIDVHLGTPTATVKDLKRSLSEALGDPTRVLLFVEGRELGDEECVLEASCGRPVSARLVSAGINTGTAGTVQVPTMATAHTPTSTNQQAHMKLLQSLLARHPEALSHLLSTSPHLQSLLKSSPHLRAALQNPAVLSDLAHMMTDPLHYQEAMRASDRAMSQMEMVPQGFQMLRQMHEQMASAEVDFGFGGGGGRGKEGEKWEGKRQRTLQKRPLPNPWGLYSNDNDNDTDTDSGEE